LKVVKDQLQKVFSILTGLIFPILGSFLLRRMWVNLGMNLSILTGWLFLLMSFLFMFGKKQIKFWQFA
tara:strand:- start:29110 stop:29313 length:204 start_codon:yes stop_codon:yes gene_type:complete